MSRWCTHIHLGTSSTVYHSIDLDDDNNYDIKICSLRDSIIKPYEDNKLYVKIEILNSNIIIPEIQHSGERCAVPSDTTIDTSNTYPLIIYKRNVVCGYDPDSISDQTIGNTPRYVFSGDCVDDNNYNWSNSEDHVSLYRNSYIYRQYYGLNVTADTVIYEWYYCPVLCEELPQDYLFYLPFKKIYGSSEKYGWIELKLINNTVEIYRIAIQD